MITRYRAWMNGKALDEIAESIIITDIVEPEPEMDAVSLPLAGRSGSRMQSQHRRSKTVQIQLMIREYDVKTRKDVYSQVLTWAQSGDLEINDREGLVLHGVRLTGDSSISALKWTEKITLSLTAYDVPYWMDKEALTLEGSGGSPVTLRFAARGNVPGWVDLTVVNKGTEPVYGLVIQTNNKYFFYLTGLILAPESVLVISHDNAGVLSIEVDGKSSMRKRSGLSADDLMTNVQGWNAVSVFNGKSIEVTARVRGLWL